MAARFFALLPRLAVLTVVWLLAASAITLAAAGQTTQGPAPAAAAAASKGPQLLVIPDVRSQVYVFAKGMLEDGGFAWRVQGSVRGFAANSVAGQSPAPGTKVVDTGAPTVRLQLSKAKGYEQLGEPETKSPYPGTEIKLKRIPGDRQ